MLKLITTGSLFNHAVHAASAPVLSCLAQFRPIISTSTRLFAEVDLEFATLCQLLLSAGHLALTLVLPLTLTSGLLRPRPGLADLLVNPFDEILIPT